MEKKQPIKLFRALFGEEPIIVRAPGRINLIGEHTDYNQGFVLPAAIDRDVHICISKRSDNLVKLYAVQYNEGYEITLNDMKPVKGHWSGYILGVADQLLKKGCSLGGFNVLVDGNVPLGAGMSSSAALECASAFALNELFQLQISRLEMAFIAQAAEHEFVGVKCGIMDQFASLFGKKDHVIKLDCRSLEYEYLPLQLGEYRIVLLDTHVKHNLASSEYNKRREECEAGVATIKKYNPGVSSLRDVELPVLYTCVKDPVIRQRCEFVIKENLRVLAACEDLRKGDIRAFGMNMFATHDGLSREYEVSCDESDFLVNSLRDHPGVAGARMMGGGFGGCTINLLKEESVGKLIDQTGEAYWKKTGKKLDAYILNTDDSCSVEQHAEKGVHQ